MINSRLGSGSLLSSLVSFRRYIMHIRSSQSDITVGQFTGMAPFRDHLYPDFSPSEGL